MNLEDFNGNRRHAACGVRYGRAFSLVELLVVTSIVALLLALTLPGFVALGPSRKTAIHEVSGFLENARARAVAAKSEMIVAFADEWFHDESGSYRAYALFTPGITEFGEIKEGEALRQLTPWRYLPDGLVFAAGRHFEVENGISFRTIHELSYRIAVPLSPAIKVG